MNHMIPNPWKVCQAVADKSYEDRECNGSIPAMLDKSANVIYMKGVDEKGFSCIFHGKTICLLNADLSSAELNREMKTQIGHIAMGHLKESTESRMGAQSKLYYREAVMFAWMLPIFNAAIGALSQMHLLSNLAMAGVSIADVCEICGQIEVAGLIFLSATYITV